MKILNLLMWVGQFGFSVIFPTVLFLYVAVLLQHRFDLGIWIVILFGLIGILTSISTTRACLQSMQKAAKELSGEQKRPLSFNDHK
jgi:formate hydrogenlyase subunit 3/multisubunit Na+/H+ antiporter MnhD subunit